LKAKADKIGVKYQKTIGEAKLEERIAAKEEEQKAASISTK